MKSLKFSFILIVIILRLSYEDLICPPDHFIKGETYWDEKDYINKEEEYYGFVFSYILIDTYYDRWNGIIYEPNNFCDGYTLLKKNEDNYKISYSPSSSGNFIYINKSKTNFDLMYNYLCESNNFKFYMDKDIDITENYFDLYFRIANIYDGEAQFEFRVVGKKNNETEYFTLGGNYTLSRHHVELYKLSFKLEKKFEPNHFTIKTLTESSGDIICYFKEKNIHKMEIEIKTYGSVKIGVVTYQMMYRRNSSSTYLGKNECNNDNECEEGSICVSNKCKLCNEYSCKKCESTSPYNCKQCYSISPFDEWDIINQKSCTLEYIDLTKFTLNINGGSFKVLPAIHWKVTMDYWIWINYPLNLKKHLDIIYTDFMAITMDKGNQDDDLDIFCIPIEWLYHFSDSNNSTYSEYSASQFINEVLGDVYVEDYKKNIASKWIYVRCGFDLKSSKMYLNDLIESNINIPQLYITSGQEQSNFPFHMKKFYHYDETVELKFINFEKVVNKSTTWIYLRNVNIYKEYIPQNIQTKYWNLHGNEIYKSFPQLLYSIPFITENNSYKFKSYSYGKTSSTGSISYQSLEHTLSSNDKSLKPPRLFQRLNFLNPNKQAKTCDYNINDLDSIICDNNRKYCFDNNKAFACDTSSNYLLDINSLSCNKYCPIGYTRPPRDNNNLGIKGLYCSEKCALNSIKCPNYEVSLDKIDEEFECDSTNDFELYYNCYNKNSNINTVSGGLFFSSTLNSKKIVLYVNKNGGYENYAISAWIYVDKRFSLPDNNDLVFQTNEINVFNNKVSISSNSFIPSYKLDNNNWNHMFLTFEKKYKGGNQFHLSFQNEIYKKDPVSISTNHILKFINFENTNSNKWINAYYRDIRILDIKYSNRYAAFMFNQYGLGVNTLLKHRFIYKLETLRHNKLIDDIGDGEGEIVEDIDNKFNPDNTNYLIYAANFAIEHAFSSSSTSSSFIIKEVNTISKYLVDVSVTSSSTRCKIATSNNTCLSCVEGYSLFSDKCMRQESNDYNNVGDAIEDFPSLEQLKKKKENNK